jgi:hypothetical protein
LSVSFGVVVQFDLLFIEDKIIAVLIDEATRWTVADVITDRETPTILKFFTDRWLRIFGPITTVLSDQEGALYSEQGAVWSETVGTSLRPKPKGSHAALVERHHQVLRDLMHKLLTESRSKGLVVEFTDCLSEAVFAKNIFTNVGGFSPFQAVFGRFPAMLADLENAGISSISDGASGTARHVVRLRELAISAMVEATAQSRMRMAENSKTRMSGELLGLEPGDQVDLYRKPARKELSGWRGPAEIVSVNDIP